MALQGLLVRVGVDQTFGGWNAPCNPRTREFVYVPIPQEKENAEGMGRYYSEFIVPALDRFSMNNQHQVSLPEHLRESRMHLDPDFDHLTYGDTIRRGRPLLALREDDLVVFYSGLRSIDGRGELVYALIGLLIVESVRQVRDISQVECDNNAHTRNARNDNEDIVVKGKPGVSGRFQTYVPIGEYRDRSYRVTRELLDSWGGISAKDGWIQRSATLPKFLAANRFSRWLDEENPGLQAVNN